MLLFNCYVVMPLCFIRNVCFEEEHHPQLADTPQQFGTVCGNCSRWETSDAC
jgi:hypothetical protein